MEFADKKARVTSAFSLFDQETGIKLLLPGQLPGEKLFALYNKSQSVMRLFEKKKNELLAQGIAHYKS